MPDLTGFQESTAFPNSTSTVLLIGGTGSVGQLVLQQLLNEGFRVKAIVRSPGVLGHHDQLEEIEASITSMPLDDLRSHVKQVDAVVITLGHRITLRGVFGPPYRLVLEATKRVFECCEQTYETEGQSGQRRKVVALNTVGVSTGKDPPRGWFESSFIWMLSSLVPPYADSIATMAYIQRHTEAKGVDWVVVRPDAFKDGVQSPFEVHEVLQNSLFHPKPVTKANIAVFMVDLLKDKAQWEKWSHKAPVIFDQLPNL